jgi:hypothetical protein
MADAEDLKSSGDFSSCGFDSHPGHQSFLLKILVSEPLPSQHESRHVQVAEQRADRGRLRGSLSFIPIARTPMLIPFLVGLFNRSFQEHLDQMQHGSVDDPSSHRL